MMMSRHSPWLRHLNPVLTQVDRWRERFDQRSRRERLLVITTAVILCGAMADHLWLSPAFKQWRANQALAQQAKESFQHAQHDLVQRQATLQLETTQRQADLVQLQHRLQTTTAALTQAGTDLLAPDQMMKVLEQLLSQHTGVRLQALQSHPPQRLSGIAPNAPAASPSSPLDASNLANLTPGPGLYRHSVTLTVEGHYTHLLAYVQALEALSPRLGWTGANLKVQDHPRVRLTLNLSTLSLHPGWLEV